MRKLCRVFGEENIYSVEGHLDYTLDAKSEQIVFNESKFIQCFLYLVCEEDNTGKRYPPYLPRPAGFMIFRPLFC